MDDAWRKFKRLVRFANAVVPEGNAAAAAASRAFLVEQIEEVTARCREERARLDALETPEDLSDAALVKAARFTDNSPLAPFGQLLHLTPRLVNVSAAAPPRARGARWAPPIVRFFDRAHRW